MVVLGDRYKFSQNEIKLLKKEFREFIQIDISSDTINIIKRLQKEKKISIIVLYKSKIRIRFNTYLKSWR